MALASINRVRYIGGDFDSIVDDARYRLQVKFAVIYNDFALAALGMMLLDTVAYGLDTLSFYLDRRATEVYLETARTRRGVARITRQLGYKMGGAVASSTDLEVGIPATSAQAFTVSILPGFQFQGPNELIFEAAELVEWSPAEQTAGITKLVPVYEGETITETFTSDGTANQVFTLSRVPTGKAVASGSVVGNVDGALWQENNFLEFGATNQFEVGYNDDPPTLRFGTGVVGNIPPASSSIVCTYVATSGRAGRVGRQTIQAEVAPLVVAGEEITLVIDNPSAASGGDDLESLESAKAFAGRVFASRKLAITGPDYDALAGSYADPLYGRVAVAKAISSRSASQDMALQEALLILSGALQGPVDAIQAAIDAAVGSGGSLEGVTDQTSAMSLALASLADSSVSIGTNVAALVSGIRANRNLTLDIDSDAETAQNEAQAADTVVSGFVVGASDQIQAATLDTLLGHFGNIDSLMGALKAKTSTIRAASDTQVAASGVISDELDKVGDSTAALQSDGSDSYLKALEDARVVVVDTVGVYDTDDPSASTGLYLTFGYILQGEADALNPTTSGEAAQEISTQLQAIYDHVDRILSSDCAANLISVPILVQDAAGFYTAPSNGLINSLREYLDERKEVTQTVEVVSGAKFLVYPKIKVRLGVRQGYSLERTRTAAETAIDGVLRGRGFGLSLHVSDISRPLEGIEGVGFYNVTILGYTTVASPALQSDKLDVEGNLIIERTEVITKLAGQIAVTPELYIPRSV